jgi:dTDP-glucose pyrophosphorylase
MVKDIQIEPTSSVSNFTSAGLMRLSEEFFLYLDKLYQKNDRENDIHTVLDLMICNGFEIKAIKYDSKRININTKYDLREAHKLV